MLDMLLEMLGPLCHLELSVLGRNLFLVGRDKKEVVDVLLIYSLQ